MITDLTDTKIKVNSPEESERVQKRAFELGWSWYANEKNTISTDKKFLYFFKDKSIYYGSTSISSFTESLNKEITLEDLFGEEKPEIETWEYAVCIKDVRGYNGTLNYCYKRIAEKSYKTFRYSIVDTILYNLLRPATKEEAEEYERRGKPYDITTINNKKQEPNAEELKVDTWYINTCFLIYRKKRHGNYGFSLSDVTYCTRLDCITPSNWREATEEEVRKVFTDYIKKEYPEGTVYVAVNLFNNSAFHAVAHEMTSTSLDTSVWCNKDKCFAIKYGNIFVDGVWSKTVSGLWNSVSAEPKIDSWCVEVTAENREVIKRWMNDDKWGYYIGSYYGIDKRGEKFAHSNRTYFNKIISTKEFYEKIGHKGEPVSKVGESPIVKALCGNTANTPAMVSVAVGCDASNQPKKTKDRKMIFPKTEKSNKQSNKTVKIKIKKRNKL